MKLVTKLTGPDAYEQAKRRARRGPFTWIGYKNKAGELIAEIESLQSVKQALLAKGTKGRFSYFTKDGKLLLSWRHGVNLFMQLKYPYQE